MIIGFLGYKGVGKSTACDIIKKEFLNVQHINFKDALVAEIKQNFPDLLEELVKIYYYQDGVFKVDDLFRSKPKAMRAFMQNYGTELRRSHDENYWVDKWKSSIQTLNALRMVVDHVVVDDVRFKNEAAAVKDQGGILIRLIRPDITTGGTHASETEIDAIVPDYTITVEQGEHDRLRVELLKILNGEHR